MDAFDIRFDDRRANVHAAVEGVTRQFTRADYLAAARGEGSIDGYWKALGEQGLFGLGVPEEYGGSGGGITEAVAAMEALSQAGMPSPMLLLTAFSRVPILRYGTDEQKRRFVEPTADGSSRFCFAITEPDAGTNSFAITSLAQPVEGGGYRLNGQKVFISGADEADRMLVVARTTRLADAADRKQGLSLFVVDTDAPGVSMQQLNIELHCPEKQFMVFFDDVALEPDRLIGEEGHGINYLFDALNPERLIVSAWALGLGDLALSKGVAYAMDRAPFGTPIGAYQGLQHPMARAKAHLEAARTMLYQAADAYDRGLNAGPLANMAKLLASEAAQEACDIAIQAHGGNAFDTDFDVITLWPMIRLLRVAPINNEMVLNHLGEHVLGLPRSY